MNDTTINPSWRRIWTGLWWWYEQGNDTHHTTIKSCCRGCIYIRVCIRIRDVVTFALVLQPQPYTRQSNDATVYVPWPVHGRIWRTTTHNNQIKTHNNQIKTHNNQIMDCCICFAATSHKKQEHPSSAVSERRVVTWSNAAPAVFVFVPWPYSYSCPGQYAA